MTEQPKISCLMLAAGYSRRMGKPKLDLPLGQSTVLGTSLAAVLAVPFQERVLVVRDYAPAPGFSVLAIGEEASLGMHRSIRLGLQALKPCDAVCIALADQPYLRTEDLQALVDAWKFSSRGGRDLVFPTHEGQRGNPAIVSAKYFAEILAEPDNDRGCHYLFQRHPSNVYEWPASAPGFYRDLDDWETYLKCLN